MVDKRDEADKLIDKLIAGKTPEEIVGEGGLLAALTKRIYERALDGELTHHLGYPPHAPEGKNSGNSRNGKTSKTVKTDRGFGAAPNGYAIKSVFFLWLLSP
jgi:transposase-like protein